MLLNGLGFDFSGAKLAIKPSILTNKPGWSPAPSITTPTSTNKGTLIKSNLFDRYKSRSNPNISVPVNQSYVNAAVDTLNNTPSTISPSVITPTSNTSPLVIPPPYSGGGGSSTASDSPTDPTQQPPATGLAAMWGNLSTTGKLAVVGGGIVIIYYGYKMFKGGRTATAPKSKQS